MALLPFVKSKDEHSISFSFFFTQWIQYKTIEKFLFAQRRERTAQSSNRSTFISQTEQQQLRKRVID